MGIKPTIKVGGPFGPTFISKSCFLYCLGLINEGILQMLGYVFKKRNDVSIIDVKKTWEKLLLAARVIASIENPADVCVISSRNFGQVCLFSFSSFV